MTTDVSSQTCKADLTVDGFKNAALYIPAVGIVTPICIMITVIQELINGPMGPIVGLIVNLPIIAAVSYGEIPPKLSRQAAVHRFSPFPNTVSLPSSLVELPPSCSSLSLSTQSPPLPL